MIKRWIGWVAALLSAGQVYGQVVSVSGYVRDSAQHPLFGANVLLLGSTDSAFVKGAVTDMDGHFTVPDVGAGRYVLKVTYIGYGTYLKPVSFFQSTDLGTITLQPGADNLHGILIEDKLPAMKMRGDTTEYNAAAYKVNVDANAQDLLTKMPGITVQDGKVQAQGEDIKKVLVNGREFFGDDASIALKNLPAEVIDKVQVFDKWSDQSRFTGFNDGNTEKTVNITTKEDKSNGTFGKVYAGYGTRDRYSLGGNINIFKGVQRISIIGMSNNINEQNFSSQDLLGISSGSGSSGQRGGFGPGAGGPPPGGGFTGGGENVPLPGRPNNSTGNFLTGQSGGINTNTSLGLNYVDEWGKKVKVTGSYFFNNSKNTTDAETYRTYFLSDSSTQTYRENSVANSNNINHRVNLRLEYTIDASNSLIFTPSFNYQKNTSTTNVSAASQRSGSMLNNSVNDYATNLAGYNFSNTMLFRHKFAKAGRTLSIDLTGSYNTKNGSSGLGSTAYYALSDSSSVINQQALTKNAGYTVSSNWIYTEPLSKSMQLMLSASPSYTRSFSDKSTNAWDSLSGAYTRLDSSLSNTYRYGIWKNKAGVGIRLSKNKVNLSLSADYQFVSLAGNETFPVVGRTLRVYHNILPRFDMMYNATPRLKIHMAYNPYTQTPSVTQLQNVLDNSNPLSVSRGNPALAQQYMHWFISGIHHVDASMTRMFFLGLGGSLSDSYIASSTLTAATDTVLTDGTRLAAGSQYTTPVNLKGYRNLRAFAVYGLPLPHLKTNLNLNGGYTYTRLPGLVNGTVNYANTSNVNLGVTLSSNISTKYDFTVSYMANYNFVKNSIQSSSDQNYYSGVASARVNVRPVSFLVLSSDISYTHYVGLNDVSNPSILLWNAAVGYKFLKSKAAEIKLSVYDILNKNNSVSRTVTNTYVEDTQTRVLKRYFMLTFTYTLRNFKS